MDTLWYTALGGWGIDYQPQFYVMRDPVDLILTRGFSQAFFPPRLNWTHGKDLFVKALGFTSHPCLLVWHVTLSGGLIFIQICESEKKFSTLVAFLQAREVSCFCFSDLTAFANVCGHSPKSTFAFICMYIP